MISWTQSIIVFSLFHEALLINWFPPNFERILVILYRLVMCIESKSPYRQKFRSLIMHESPIRLSPFHLLCRCPDQIGALHIFWVISNSGHQIRVIDTLNQEKFASITNVEKWRGTIFDHQNNLTDIDFQFKKWINHSVMIKLLLLEFFTRQSCVVALILHIRLVSSPSWGHNLPEGWCAKRSSTDPPINKFYEKTK